jgi:hypothetical protein
MMIKRELVNTSSAFFERKGIINTGETFARAAVL